MRNQSERYLKLFQGHVKRLSLCETKFNLPVFRVRMCVSLNLKKRCFLLINITPRLIKIQIHHKYR